MLINIFLLLPLFWIRRKDTHNTQLGQLTMSNILDSKHRLWTVYFITIIFAFMAFTMLYMFKRKVRRLSLEDAVIYIYIYIYLYIYRGTHSETLGYQTTQSE